MQQVEKIRKKSVDLEKQEEAEQERALQLRVSMEREKRYKRRTEKVQILKSLPKTDITSETSVTPIKKENYLFKKMEDNF
jgi:hypothetical protein